MESPEPIAFVVPVGLQLASDIANLAVAGAFMLGLPFVALRLIPLDTARWRWICLVGLAFGYMCGLFRLLMVALTHQPSLTLLQVSVAINLVTASVCWLFVALILNSVDRQGNRRDDGP